MSADATVPAPLLRRVAWRFVPLLFISYVVAQIDRVNVGFAKLTMLADLGFGEAVYGLGAGIFFIGYMLFEVPANLLLVRFGARRWLSRIMISWGLLSAATMFVTTPAAFYAVRFLLGVAEAGFFPGIIFYLTHWFSRAQRTRITAFLMAAIAVSGVTVGPLSGLIVSLFDGRAGLHGWQWLFLLEALPAIGCGIVLLWWLDDSPATARFLTAEERTELQASVADDQDGLAHVPVRTALRSGRVWLLGLLYACYGVSFFGLVFWLPTLMREAGVQGSLTIGLLSAIPWSVAVLTMLVAARFAERHGHDRALLLVFAAVAAIGWLLSPSIHLLPLSIAVFALVAAAVMGSLPLFWNMPTTLFRGPAAAAAIALVTTIGNIPGFLSPYLVGLLFDATGRLDLPMYVFGATMLLAMVLIARLQRKPHLHIEQAIA